MTIHHIISLWPTRVDMGHLWARAYEPMGQERWLVHALGEAHCFPKPYGSRKISPHNIYASSPPIILSMWDLVSHMKYFQHSPLRVSHIIPRTTFGSDNILGCNSSHNLTVAQSCGHGTQVGPGPQTHGLRALTCTVGLIIFQNHTKSYLIYEVFSTTYVTLIWNLNIVWSF